MSQWHSCFARLPLASLVAAPNGQMLFANEALARLLGRPLAALSSAQLADLVVVHRRSELAEAFRAVRRTAVHRWDSELIRSDGSRFAARLSGSAVRDAAGTLLGMLVHVQELTPLLQAERQSVRFDTLRAVVNGLPIVLFASDAEGRIRLAEGGSLDMIGTDRERLLGASLFEMFRDVSWIVNNLRRILSGGPSFVGAGEFAGRFFETTYIATRDREGAVTGLLGLAIDITEQHRAERERDRLIGQLERAVQTRDEFLSIASHELRTPFSALKLKLELMRRRTQKADGAVPLEHVLHQIEQIGGLSARLTRLVNQLLDATSAAAESLELRRETLDLARLVTAVNERMRVLFEHARCTLVVKAQESVVGSWDRTRLEQVLENLLSNAIKHGGGGGRVELSLGADDACATVVIRDYGPGIPVSEQARIFERFARLAPHALGGLGLGLYISRQIAEAHGGTLRVESQPGTGTAFVLNLPRKRQEHPA